MMTIALFISEPTPVILYMYKHGRQYNDSISAVLNGNCDGKSHLSIYLFEKKANRFNGADTEN